MRVLDDGETTWLLVDAGAAASLAAWLDRMRFMLRVEVADRSAEFGTVGYFEVPGLDPPLRGTRPPFRRLDPPPPAAVDPRPSGQDPWGPRVAEGGGSEGTGVAHRAPWHGWWEELRGEERV